MEDALHAYMCLAPSYPVTPTDILSDEFITKVNRDSGSEEAFHLVRAWLQDCREKHVKCLPTIFSAPARVLDLQGPDQDMVYLKETKGACCPYAALSYCWGPTFCSDTEIATLKENVQLFQDNGILIEDLPKTLREAVQATRRLDIRYLWIDRLCIIQDDSSDWMSNASLMCDVYSGAEITLSADHSSSTQGGLFNDNQSYSNFEYHPYVDPDGELTHRQLLIPPSHPIFEGQVLENTHPVDSRAWILQERLMSHRILHFTSQEMVWECNEATTCECRRGSSSPTRALTTPPPGGWTTEILYSEWRDIVKSYKMRTLTEPADEFPALKGIATKFYRLLQGCSAIGGMSDNYMAGMWKNNLAAEMAWKRGNDADTESFRRRIKSNKAPESKDKTKGEGKEDIQERIRAWRQDQLDPTDKYIAPSWSWASQPGPKDYYRYWPEVPFQSQIDLVDVQLTPRSANDPWGQLESGYITISGHMVKNMELVTAFGLFEQEGTDERKGAPVYYLEYSAGSMRWVIGFEADDPGELIDEYRLQEPKFVLLLLGTIDTKKVPPRIFGLSSPFIYLLTKREYLKDESSNEASPAVAKSSAPPSVDHQTGEFRRDSIYLVLVESNDHPGKYQRLGCMEVGLMTEHRLLMQDLFMYSVKQEITLV
ncbi:heterokaryon incompatibility protein-domain-containing protein [Hypoxylon rubiginosum]|uniref:Heterokaryon incompatibility protein-domain-containing protein n=1 Tax=Hypoxylon rubiginosum TaxID=110542 RepID=A0ACC0CK46_9PEZI|nr:heterokaryon incompatibility protein-domain-containing protein [Hypoxylon rubiginosum]